VAKRRLTVDQWVHQVISEVVDGKACSAVSLLHLKGVGGATEEVVTKPLEGTVNVKELADNLIGRAEGFSQDIPGIQTFKLIAFYGSNEPHTPFHFTTSDGNIISRTEAAQSAHEPTPAGLLGQLMKHNENLMHQNNQLVTANMTMAQGMMAMCFGNDGVVQRSMRAQLEAIEVVKDASLDMFDKRRQLVLEEHKAAQELQTRKAIIDAVPHLVNRWTGHEVFDEKSNRAKLLETIALKMSPDDLKLLVEMGKISKEESLVISAQFAAIVEEKKKELEALRKVPSETEPPKNGNALAKGNGL
jgi:hypothetical protein